LGKKDKDDDLDKDSRKRLEKLAEQWSETPSSWSLEKLTPVDLKLLLEHWAPLQDLIRAVAAGPAGASPAALAQETTTLREHIAETVAARSAAEDDNARLLAELEKAQGQCRALQNDLAQCTATTQKFLQANGALEKQMQQAQKDLAACSAELARSGSAPGELALLRQDAELAQRLELADLPADDSRALIQIVAVLAQRDNLERLWSALKERCEAQNRPAHDPERALLVAALAWHNYNWRTRPYRLVEATPGAAYDFERHLRSRHVASGEIVAELRLPGIADGGGKPLCKALVSTR
jgi:septal ring factor EnvC (AmiA/AmiB activator)